MTKNNKRKMNAVTARIAAVATAFMLVMGCAFTGLAFECAAHTGDGDAPVVYIVGVDASNGSSGEGWEYDPDEQRLTLNNFSYEGTGIFVIDDSADDESYDWDDDEDWDEGDDDWDDDEDLDDEDEDGQDEDEDSDEANTIHGVIYSTIPLKIRLIGDSNIYVYDDGENGRNSANMDGDLVFEGSGTISIGDATKSAHLVGSDFYMKWERGESTDDAGNEPADSIESKANEHSTSEFTEENASDVTETEEIQDDDGEDAESDGDDQSHSNESDYYNVTQNAYLYITEINCSERIIDRGFCCKYPDKVAANTNTSFAPGEHLSENTYRNTTPVVDISEDKEARAEAHTSPETADPNSAGIITALIATVIGCAVALIVLIRRRVLER